MLRKKKIYFIAKLIYVWYYFDSMLLIFSEFTIHLIYSRIRVCACIVIVTLSSVLVSSLYILSMREEERGRKVVSRDKPRFADETRERGEKEAGGLKKSVKGTGAGQGIINARVSLTSVGQKSSSGPCLAIERPRAYIDMVIGAWKQFLARRVHCPAFCWVMTRLLACFAIRKERSPACVNFLEQFLAISKSRTLRELSRRKVSVYISIVCGHLFLAGC